MQGHAGDVPASIPGMCQGRASRQRDVQLQRCERGARVCEC